MTRSGVRRNKAASAGPGHGDRRAPFRLTPKFLDEAVKALASRPIHRERQPDERGNLILSWGMDDTEELASALGRLSKWTIALWLACRGLDEGTDLKNLLKLETVRGLKQIFLADEEGIKTEGRLDPQAAPVSENDDVRPAMSAIFAFIKRRLNHPGRSELKVSDILEFEAHIAASEASSLVGEQPIRDFQNWLKFETHVVRGKSNAAPSAETEPVTAAIGGAIRLAQRHRRPYACVANVYGSTDPGLGAKLETEWRGQIRAEGLGIGVQRISLGPGATRAGVTEQLYATYAPNLVWTPPAGRAIDLQQDLAPIRRSLTVSGEVLILENWENSSGPYSALHDFVNNTNWAEYIRALAQPQLAVLDAESPTPSPCIIVISSARARGLSHLCFSVVRGVDGTERKPAEGPDKTHGLEPPAPVLLYQSDSLHEEAPEGGGSAPYRSPAGVLLGRPASRVRFAVLAFIAASVNGLQRSTLRRCLRNWVLFQECTGLWPTGGDEPGDPMEGELARRVADLLAGAALDELLQDLLSGASSLLHEVADDDTEGVTQGVRQVELNSRPQAPSLSFDGPPAGLSVQFKSALARSHFIRDWLNHERQARASGFSSTGTLRWNVANHVLAEESLRQATVMVRQHSANAVESANSVRKFAQAIFHGLAGVVDPLPVEHEPDVFRGDRHAPAVPCDRFKRYRYLYLFVYQHCVEGDDWRLGRSLGKSDVRLDLLTMLLAPQSSLYLLVYPDKSARDWHYLPPLYETEPDLPIEDRLLRCELIQSLGRAGLDSGQGRGRYATKWALSVLPGWLLRPDLRDKFNLPRPQADAINAKLPSRGEGYLDAANDSLKLRIDWLQSQGRADLLDVSESLCEEQLERMGLPAALIRQICHAAWASLVADMPAPDDAQPHRPEPFPTLEHCLQAVLDQLDSPRERKLCADVMFRLAEVFATKADNLEQRDLFSAADNRTIYAFLSACAVYWTADRIRSSVGKQASSGLRWPMAGARSLRYYVRAYLKLARLLVERGRDAPGLRSPDVPQALLEHAQSRLSIFTRHHFGFFRERVSSQLLESARIRSWVRIDVESIRARFMEACVERLVERAVITDQLMSAQTSLGEAEVRLRQLSRDLQSMGRTHSTPVANQQALVNKARDDLTELNRRCASLKSIPVAPLDETLDAIAGQLHVLAQSRRRIDEAEQLLLSLGYQRHHVMRLFLERTKFASTMVRTVGWAASQSEVDDLFTRISTGFRSHSAISGTMDPDVREQLDQAHEALRDGLRRLAIQSEVQIHLRIATWTLAALSEAADGDRFWTAIARRQREGLGLTLNRASKQLGIKVDLPA